MSLGDQFQVTLPSNVKGNNKNKPGEYETTLATPLDLPGDWEVALIDITYPHTWINLNKEYHLAVLTIFNDSEEDQKQHIGGDSKTSGLIRGMDNVESFPLRTNRIEAQMEKLYVKNIITIVPGQYDIQSLVNLIETEIQNVGYGLTSTTVEYSKERNRVSISASSRLSILASYKSHSLLRLLGFNKSIKLNRDFDVGDSTNPARDDRDEVDYLMLNLNKPVEADQSPLVTPISSIFVYTDFIEYVMVGNSQTPLLGYLPVQSTWGNQAYWSFNPAYYVRVKEQNIRCLSIKLCNDLGDVINFENGHVICRLHFRRIR